KRRRDIADRTAPRLPGTVARLVQVTVITRIGSGGVKTSVVRVLTTLLDPGGFPPPVSLPCTPKVSQLLARRAKKWLQRWLAGTGRLGAAHDQHARRFGRVHTIPRDTVTAEA
ncbi:MAG: hypothetical protein ACTHPS_13710, partial [Streptosporangiaceae bacterium]